MQFLVKTRLVVENAYLVEANSEQEAETRIPTGNCYTKELTEFIIGISKAPTIEEILEDGYN